MLPRIPVTPPYIKPHIDQGHRSLWSVMIPVFNCSQYLSETIQSVLAQNIPEESMQIEVVDDFSTDTDVAALVKRMGKGRVRYFRQEHNVGSLRNFETCINRAEGRLIHILHGDDKISAGYYETIGKLFQEHPEAGAAFSGIAYIDGQSARMLDHTPQMDRPGILDNWLHRIASNNEMQYVAVTVKRDVYEQLGSFYAVTYGEDWEMWVRIARHYPVAYTPEVLAFYRLHTSSISGKKILNGDFLKDTRKVIELIQNHLPSTQKNAIYKASRKSSAAYGLRIAKSTWHQTHNIINLIAQLVQIIKTSPDMQTIKQILKWILSGLYKNSRENLNA